MLPLNLFYSEPQSDRWVPYDRYPRGLIRRIVRGKPRIGGQQRVFVNLCAGLDRLGVNYRVNDFRHAMRNPDQIACVVGKPFLLDSYPWKNPILLGASVFSHPLEDPDLLNRLPVREVLVPGEWCRKMFEPYFGSRVKAWPVGIDTDYWSPSTEQKPIDILVYDKVRWEHDRYQEKFISPILNHITANGLKYSLIRYGYYEEDHFKKLLGQCKSMVFLCEHETQGIAYQQALSANVPIFAWDRGGFWQDPKYYPKTVQFEPVSSVPYWDDRCGSKFTDLDQFYGSFDQFWQSVTDGKFSPRDYILENLTLESSAAEYLKLYKSFPTH